MNNKNTICPPFFLLAGFLAFSAFAEAASERSCPALARNVQSELVQVQLELKQSAGLVDFQQAIARRYDKVEGMLAEVEACLASAEVAPAELRSIRQILDTLSADARALVVSKYERWMETRLSEIDLLEKNAIPEPEAAVENLPAINQPVKQESLPR